MNVRRKPKIVFSIALLLGLVNSSVQAEGADWTSPQLHTVPVTKRYEGRLQPKEFAYLRSQVAAQVSEVKVESRQALSASELMVLLDARVIEQRVITAEAHYKSALAARQLAVLEFEQQQQLFKQQHTGLTELKRREAALTLADANVAVALAEVETIRVERQYFNIQAPYRGMVGKVAVKAGDWIRPGELVAEYYDNHVWQVIISVPEGEALKLANIDPALIKVVLSDSPTPDSPSVAVTQITLIPSLQNVSRSRTLELQIQTDDIPLLPDMQVSVVVNAALLGGSADDASIWLPYSSIIQRGGMTAVLVLNKDDAIVMRFVRLGRYENSLVEILGGVTTDDKVLKNPEQLGRT